IEVTSGAALLWQLHHDRNESRRAAVERITLRVVGWGFIALAVYITCDQCSHYGAFVVNIRAGINSPRSGEPRDPLFVSPTRSSAGLSLRLSPARWDEARGTAPARTRNRRGLQAAPSTVRRADPQRPEKAAWLTFESFGNASTMKVFMIIEQGTKICIRIVRTS